MKYKIYSLEYPEHLQTDGHGVLGIGGRAVLEEVDVGYPSEFDDQEKALHYINDNSKELHGCELCILPIVKVAHDNNFD